MEGKLGNKCPLFTEKNCTFNFKDKYDELPSSKKTELLIFLLKSLWFHLTMAIFGVGVSLIFLGAIISFWIDPLASDNLKIFESLQSWVGVGLGIIATVFSIISMFLSFYNLEQQKESEKNVIELNNNLQNNIVKEVTKSLVVEIEKVRGAISILETKINEIPTLEIREIKEKKIVNEGIKAFFKKNEVE